jgi:hypothetical protein
MPSEVSKRICLQCGVDISARHWRAKYCSQKCRDRYLYAQAHPRLERHCAWCGVDISAKKRHAIYCSRICKTKASDDRRLDDGRSLRRDRARYQREAEHRKEYARRYLVERPGFAKAMQLRRKARLRAVPAYRFTERDWRRLRLRYDNRCAYCGEQTHDLQREHLIPISRGGSHGIGNIVPACPRCNYAKRTSLPIEWKRRLIEERG